MFWAFGGGEFGVRVHHMFVFMNGIVILGKGDGYDAGRPRLATSGSFFGEGAECAQPVYMRLPTRLK